VEQSRSSISGAAGVALFVLALHAFAAGPESAGDWIPVGTDHGVSTFKREVSGSGIVAVKGEGAVDAPVWKVASVLLDTRRAAEWVDSLKESRVVRRLGPDRYIEYNHLHLPLVIKDREFVSEVRIDVDPSDHSVTLVYHPTDAGEVPPSHFVRGQIRSGSFRARPRSDGHGSDLTAEIDCDPKGALPAWLVNFFQKTWPRNTFDGIRRQVAKPDVRMPEEFQSLLERTTGF
jgi:hypothetical protein